MRVLVATLGLIVLAVAGCGGEDPFAPPERSANTGAFGVVGGVDELAATPVPGETAEEQPEADTPEEAAAKTPPSPPKERKKAEVGVGEKGHYDIEGPIITPVAVYFRAQERITFNIDIPRHMNLYKAMNDNKGPATHEEFMEKIIKANRVDLPTLPAGERYIYDPKKEELFIQRARR